MATIRDFRKAQLWVAAGRSANSLLSKLWLKSRPKRELLQAVRKAFGPGEVFPNVKLCRPAGESHVFQVLVEAKTAQ